MITIRDYNFITRIEEMTVKQFSMATAIFNDENKLNIERYLDVIEALGAPENVINDLTNDELFEIIRDFSVETKIYNEGDQLTRTIEIDGIVYEAYPEGGEFKIKAKDLALIEKAVTKKEDFFQTLISILFKNPNLNKETYQDAHLRHKKKLFETLPAKPYVGYLIEVSKTLTQKISNAIGTTNETA